MKRTNATDRWRILAEIDAIPREQLPETATARIVLKLLALDGVVDLAVYQQPVTDAWVIWLRPADPADHGRHTLAEWRSDHLTLALAAYAVAEARGKAEVA
ncbi:MAG TPA: hypothetical protein VMV29_01035 [Ktedonobacterales bacterium]|nr:hypothetical protein [Ktedonobacterales bacterium]